MRKELDEALCAKYPLIFKDRHENMQHIIKSFNAFKLAGMAYTLEERVIVNKKVKVHHHRHAKVHH